MSKTFTKEEIQKSSEYLKIKKVYKEIKLFLAGEPPKKKKRPKKLN